MIHDKLFFTNKQIIFVEVQKKYHINLILKFVISHWKE